MNYKARDIDLGVFCPLHAYGDIEIDDKFNKIVLRLVKDKDHIFNMGIININSQ